MVKSEVSLRPTNLPFIEIHKTTTVSSQYEPFITSAAPSYSVPILTGLTMLILNSLSTQSMNRPRGTPSTTPTTPLNFISPSVMKFSGFTRLKKRISKIEKRLSTWSSEFEMVTEKTLQNVV